jgi:putative FmdB family regulatory protein
MQYEYECRKCGARFDAIVSINDRDGPVACPDCGASAKRLISMPHVCMGSSTDWSNENNGKGRRISQLDHGVRQPYYAKNQQSAIDEAHRRGLHAHKA